mgnify:CR=1 FL=1
MEKKLSPLKTIRQYCLKCCCESANEVKLCPATDCPLYGYRFGKSGRTRELSAEQRQALADRLSKARDKKE